MLDARIIEIARAVKIAGGRALVVGGSVRDRALGIDSKDVDVEAYGLTFERFEEILQSFGEIKAVGRAFGVLRIKGLDVDFSMPRKDSKTGLGHRGFAIEVDPGLDFPEAARRRDLTINSMAYDPLTEEILDPYRGQQDLANKVLRATDPDHFSEDPLRGIRVAQFAARFEMVPDEELKRLCAALDLSELSAERIFAEFRKLMLKGEKPSLGFGFLRECRLLRFFPELEAMVDVPQDPEWHPEGDVWLHTMMVLDRAAEMRAGDENDLALMFGALCHDLGKPSTTVFERGRIRSPQHDVLGVPLAKDFLSRMRAPHDLVDQVTRLVEHHLAPANFDKGGAKPRAYRRLARKLDHGGVSMELLERVARADHFGRTTEDAIARVFPAGDRFLEKSRQLQVELHAPVDVVQGRHLMERGLTPGPDYGHILARCREVQDETGWDDPERILDFVVSRDKE